ncbi:hypothetical protein EDD18DRAFT_1079208 [Armillaria luteobubalina]|uniref:DUF6697 domain-containing protein n=1 Tax=Armillaria luteobubalina TaxID=153913 RepID=A0AA39PZW3_9AGAR|nr:hypothetical protein EDD18DRAFT_1079208 [Armillaria luteobubalina]
MRVYPVDLDPEIRDVTVDRRFMSQFWGGNTQETFPTIAQKFLDIHHMDDFMYLNLNMNPHAPQMPGAPGLFFSSLSDEGDAEWSRSGIHRVFSWIDSGKWQYMGQYTMERAAPLTMEEWSRQHYVVVSTWARKVSESGYGTRCRAVVHLRHRLGRKPTKAESDQALQGGNQYKDVTKEQIAHGLRQGWLILFVWKMKCVGYDVGFQHDLVERSAGWIPPPPKPSRNQGIPRTGLKRKRKEYLDNLHSDDESVDEGAVYLPKGTKTRPIVV